tara:strand:- start:79 stop:465 length:387 start_codon:yes stop_codon:yes gene_type:complete
VKTPKDDKQKHVVSGSVSKQDDLTSTKTIDLDMSQFDILKLEEALESILGTGWVDDQLKASIAPVYVIKSDSKKVWLFNVTKKCFFEFENMTEITSIGEKVSADISYCYINNDIYEVNNELIHCLGWN